MSRSGRRCARFSGPIDDVVREADAVVIAVAHRAYSALDWAHMRSLVRTAALVDARFAVEPHVAQAHGFSFRGVGRGDR